jgi:hypothetical protein
MVRRRRLGRVVSVGAAALVLACTACDLPPAHAGGPGGAGGVDGAGARGGHGADLPWPVPSPSTSIEIPEDARAPAGVGGQVPSPSPSSSSSPSQAHAPTMTIPAAWLATALSQAGYRDLAYFDVPGGFAVRTPMELIDDQGLGMTPPDPAVRFSVPAPEERFLTMPFWSDLLAHHTGRFRIFLFLVVDEPITYSTDVTDHHLLWAHPSRELPASRTDMPYDAHDRWYALVYEFERPRGAPSARLAAQPTDPAVHLDKSGVLQALRKERAPG